MVVQNRIANKIAPQIAPRIAPQIAPRIAAVTTHLLFPMLPPTPQQYSFPFEVTAAVCAPERKQNNQNQNGGLNQPWCVQEDNIWSPDDKQDLTQIVRATGHIHDQDRGAGTAVVFAAAAVSAWKEQ